MNIKINCEKKLLIKKIKMTSDIIEKTILKKFLEIKNLELKENEIKMLKKKEIENAIKLREIQTIKEEEKEKEIEKSKIKWNDFGETNNKLTNRLNDEIDFVSQKKEKKIETAYDDNNDNEEE